MILLRNWFCFVVLLGVVLGGGCKGREGEVRLVARTYLHYYKTNQFESMWKLLSRKARARVEEQLRRLKAGERGSEEVMRILGVGREELQGWRPVDFFARVLEVLKRELSKRKEEIFHLASAQVEGVELESSVAILDLKDSFGKTRQLKLVLEGREWKVEEEPLPIRRRGKV